MEKRQSKGLIGSSKSALSICINKNILPDSWGHSSYREGGEILNPQ